MHVRNEVTVSKVRPPMRVRELKTAGTLSAYPFESVARCQCRDCGLTRDEGVGHLVRNGRFGGLTPEELGKVLKCLRSGCGGELEVVVTGYDS